MEWELEESERFRFLPTPLIRSSENQIVGVGSRGGRINQSRCTLPYFVIDLVLLLLLATPIDLVLTWPVNDGVVSGIRTLFLSYHKVLRFWLLVKTSLKRAETFTWKLTVTVLETKFSVERFQTSYSISFSRAEKFLSPIPFPSSLANFPFRCPLGCLQPPPPPPL